jgi:hypothetical protein
MHLCSTYFCVFHIYPVRQPLFPEFLRYLSISLFTLLERNPHPCKYVALIYVIYQACLNVNNDYILLPLFASDSPKRELHQCTDVDDSAYAGQLNIEEAAAHAFS